MAAPLPIDELLPDIDSSLRRTNRLILTAAPGAGKTTRVPVTLLDGGIAGTQQIIVLEPRRLATRAAAAFVARERRAVLGEQIGYRVRHESCGGAATRLWYVTEGVFGRQLIDNPFLEHVGVVILDEFHERHLSADVALAVVRELQDSVRPDLRLVIMSATLDSGRLSAYLGDCPMLSSSGRQHPVSISYAGSSTGSVAAQAASVTESVLAEHGERGDILVFLPGAAEIRRTAGLLHAASIRHDVEVVPLHGDLTLEAQQRAIGRGPRRKVVLSTNVAETSVTIEGVTTVIDCGLAREARFDARRGLNALRTVAISQAAATQRAGRAGRVAPGRCIRLGTEHDFRQRRAFETPEIARLDLSAVVLELRAWGARRLQKMPFLDSPPAAALARAETLLRQLGAVDEEGGLTTIGRRMLVLPLEPRLARCVVEAQQRHCGAMAALLIALAAERDILVDQRAFAVQSDARWESGGSDLSLRARLFLEAERQRFGFAACHSLGLDARAVQSVERARRQLLRLLRISHSAPDQSAADDAVRKSILAGFPDRLCRRRTAGAPRALMVGGSGVCLSSASVVRDSELFVAIVVQQGRAGQHQEANVEVASAVDKDWLDEVFPSVLCRVRQLQFDAAMERVVGVEELRFQDLVIERRTATDCDATAAAEILAAAAQRDPARALTVTPEANHILTRIAFLTAALPELDLPPSTQALLREVAGMFAVGCCSFAEMRRGDVAAALRSVLSSRQRSALERAAPSHYQLPTGRSVPIAYEAGAAPSISVKLQELFGVRQTPRLAAGRVALVIQLLAPNGRPVQITADLESFWTRTYPEVRKGLRGRYPKHPWPEDPLTALPTARTVRR